MNRFDYRELGRIPLPKNGPDSWLLDATPWTLLRHTYGSEGAPYEYTPAQVRVRLVMPARGLGRVRPIWDKLTDHAIRFGGDLHDEAGLPRDENPREVAAELIWRAVFAPGSPFLFVTVGVSGRMRVYSGRFDPPWTRTWHPESPGRGGRS